MSKRPMSMKWWQILAVSIIFAVLVSGVMDGLLLLYSMEWTQRVIEGIFDALAR